MAHGDCFGTDVNPRAIRWLEDQGLLWDGREVHAVTCWDSLEHLPDPSHILNRVTGWVFLSLPVFRDEEHVRESKHFRPTEHYWYFTEDGLVRWMRRQGWRLQDRSDFETVLGREDIGTFAFVRM